MIFQVCQGAVPNSQERIPAVFFFSLWVSYKFREFISQFASSWSRWDFSLRTGFFQPEGCAVSHSIPVTSLLSFPVLCVQGQICTPYSLYLRGCFRLSSSGFGPHQDLPTLHTLKKNSVFSGDESRQFARIVPESPIFSCIPGQNCV